MNNLVFFFLATQTFAEKISEQSDISLSFLFSLSLISLEAVYIQTEPFF